MDQPPRDNLKDDPYRREHELGTVQTVEIAVGGERITMRISDFTEAKAGLDKPEKNEDVAATQGNTSVLADGSTPKQGNAKEIDGMSGGRIAATISVETVLASDANGRELVDEVTEAMRRFYTDNVPEALTETQATFANTLVAMRIVEGEHGPEVVITQVGDTAFRVNGTDIYTERRRMDEIDAATRAAEIRRLMEEEGMDEAQAAARGRDAIVASLNKQHELWNNPDNKLGFAYINGRHVPDTFVKVYRFPLSQVKTIELYSDGYPLPAEEPTLASWEAAYAHVEETDPHRYKNFPATKPKDDRTVKIIEFSRN